MSGATEVADIAGVAAAIGDPSRARVLLALAGGSALPASALAAEAGVSASTVSGHLSRLLAAKLLTVERDGRHRYYRLATPEVATALEWLSRIAQPLPVHSLRQSTRAAALLRARFCYDHLAGRLGVAVMAALLDREVLAAEPADSDDVVRYLVTPAGQVELAGFGVDLSSLARRRPTVRFCLDWAEQRPHLAGPLGGALAARLFELDWIRRGHSRRVVHVTDSGEAGLRDTFGITADWAA